MPNEPVDPAVPRASDFVFGVLRNDLERQQTPDAALYLRHLIQAQVESVKPEGLLRRVRFEMRHRVSDYSVQLNALTGEPMGWYFSALAADPADTIEAQRALEIASQVAAPPAGATLEQAAYEEQAEQPVFVARWAHLEGGVVVERDYIQVLVNGASGRAFALRRRWHALNTAPAWR